MRQQMVTALENLGKTNDRFVMITADLGFHAFEGLQQALGNRFINAGVTEQHMASLAAGLAWGGMRPWIFSIAPFISLKTVEQLRNDVCSRHLPVKVIGNGGGFGYGTMGPTHHVLEDLAIMQAMPQMKAYVPAFEEDVQTIVNKMFYEDGPGYLRLGLGVKEVIKKPPTYAAVRRVLRGNKLVVLALGPMIYNILQAVNQMKSSTLVDVWVVSELPFEMPQQLLESISRVSTLLLVEEHTANGGLASFVYSSLISHRVMPYQIEHAFAAGYHSGYGSQAFHWRENGLDSDGLFWRMTRLLELGS